MFLCVTLLLTATPCAALTQTTTTTYQYNADGALTAVTTQVDAQQATTVYVTWDDFVPDASAPTTGTVKSGNGNLAGIGPTPGSGYTTRFQYDQRNRLTYAAAAGAQSVTYAYDPASMMQTSTLGSGDALRFYYGNGAAPEMVNIARGSPTSWASYLRDVTYLADGTEQSRLTPRKDVTGVYESASPSFTAVSYDPFGASATVADSPATGAPTYDLSQNPFQYAAEYADPAWGGYYLRHRWYAPQQQTFLGRDPVDRLHRYGYAGGDPIGKIDPSGLGYESFSRFLRRFLHPIDSGILGELLPLIPIYGQIAGGLTLLADLPQFWHHPTTLTWVDYGFLLSSVAWEGIAEHPYFDSRFGNRAFRGRIAGDALIGVGQTVLAGDRGHGRWGVEAMIQSAEYSFSNIVSSRPIEGFGYRPFNEGPSEVGKMAEQHFAGGAHQGEMLVYRVRKEDGGGLIGWTSPWREWRTIGGYHESIVAVGADFSLSSEIVALERKNFLLGQTLTRWDERSGTAAPYMTGKRMQFVGAYRTEEVENAFGLGAEARNPDSSYNQAGRGKLEVFGWNFRQFTNNCHDYSAQVLRRLGQ